MNSQSLSKTQKVAAARAWLDSTPFISKMQASVLRSNLTGEEGEGIAEIVLAVAKQIEDCPVTYKGDDRIHLHYFRGGYDAWITEKDMDGGVQQAFGYCSFAGAGQGELGYVSIEELVASGVELDLYWTAKPVAEVS